ncbi:MAG: dehypoxanthine futalosine cyclase [Archaeoglobaceae archaeon]|nr:dehypoxanthine futalosine cyclase [Archaeoglobaceae archaeon]MCX8152538.1 dehypoxanthine futalosine cyclase [Archaeoglobaceae archaeon]MDW8014041.1 cyclic dehypoxanthinyl futalosine synthase [Archaeoglobaceae archaeon]
MKSSALELFEIPLHDLFKIADEVRKWKCGDTVTFVVERNINYTNVCISRCKFCAFYARKKDEEFVLKKEQIVEKVDEAVKLGATQIMLQGGLNPDLNIEYFEEVFSEIKRKFKVHLHSLSAPEVLFLAKKEKMSIKEVLLRLKNAGLDSLPGGGAEILDDEVRKELSNKGTSEDWLKVMKIAHELGIPSTATMVFGHVEKPKHILNHLMKIKKLQDETRGFTAFIPWTFEPGKSELNLEKTSPLEYLKIVAISRIFLENFRNIQASWPTQGIEIATLALLCGANDLGGVMIEENVLRATGKKFKFLSLEEIVRAAKSIGRPVAQRDTYYRILRYF